MNKSKNSKAIVERMCAERNISLAEVDSVLDLYASDFSEEEIEKEINKFSPEVIEFASRMLTGDMS